MTENKRLTDDNLTAIRERAEKATGGNWRANLLCHEHRTYVVEAFDGSVKVVGVINKESDAAFIAHAREDIPKLLAEIKYLSELAGEALITLDSMHGYESEVYWKISEYLDGGDG